MSKRKCENCGDVCNEADMIAAPTCQWICPACFAEDPEAYGFDIELDGDQP
jgi:hypothetical protein